MQQPRPEHLRSPGHSKPVSSEEMAGRIARFREMQPDRAAFPDLRTKGGARDVFYMLSPGGLAGPAPIKAPHNFHLAIQTMGKGVRPTVHAHPYNEVFIPLDARFRFYWGEHLEESVVLEPFDVLSIPAGVFRTFENLDEHDAHVIAIFDHGGDPHTGIVVPPEVYEKFYRNWSPGVTPTVTDK
jgi:mannose-6-phosphate isomerase-like protein (cupin superfamily)